MPNFAVALRLEITRLTRREIRSHTKGLQKASVQYRHDIAALKREAAQLRSELARLKREAARGSAPQVRVSDAPSIRFVAKGLKSQRRRLGLSAEDYGKLAGVTGHTVYSWESGASRPRKAQLHSLASLRGIGKTEARNRLEKLRAKKLDTKKLGTKKRTKASKRRKGSIHRV